MKILITGGAGFVGRHLALRLLAQGHTVWCVDALMPRTGGIDPQRGWPLADPRDFSGFRFFPMDCRDWFRQHGKEYFDQVHHLAALVGGREVIENDPLSVAEDLAIDAMFWRWARTAQPGWIGCYSSSAAYPVRLQTQSAYRLLRESDIDWEADLGRPDLTYGWAKLTCEYLARIAYEKHGLASCIFRPFSGYGEDQDSAYPFPSILRRAIAERQARTLQVWGSGRQMRDFIHIEDCVSLILLAAQSIRDARPLNLSTGILTSFVELAQRAGKFLGANFEVRGSSDKPEGVFARGGDTALQQQLGFAPSIAFAEGIERGLKYFGAL